MQVTPYTFKSIAALKRWLDESGIHRSRTNLAKKLKEGGEEVVLTAECKIMYERVGDGLVARVVMPG